MRLSERADFCVGYFNLRGWKQLDAPIDEWPGGERCCRLLIGMQSAPQEELRQAFSLTHAGGDNVDNATVVRLRRRAAEGFREQLVFGAPTNEDETATQPLYDLYNEKSGILDGEADTEVDLASQAYQIWKNVIDQEPRLAQIIPDLPNVSYSSRHHQPLAGMPEGVLIYVRTAEGTDSLAWVDRQGNSVTQSQLAILQAAQCHPETPAKPRHPQHHELVNAGVEHLIQEEHAIGGQLGRPS